LTEYYFLTSLLPELAIGHVPALGFEELKNLLMVNLKKEDWKKVEIFLRLIDVENMRKVWTNQAIDPRGNLNRPDLEKAIHEFMWSEDEEFEDYIIDFLEKYRTPEERAAAFSFLLGTFLTDKSQLPGFLGAFYDFERKMRIVMLGLRAKKMGKKLESELQYEDSNDPIVAQVLAQRDAKSYEPPFEFKELKPIFENFGSSPTELNKELTEYRFHELQEMAAGEMFTLDRILGYMARLLLVEKWLELDVNEGIKVIDKIEGYVNG
jgi:hypothetical protein